MNVKNCSASILESALLWLILQAACEFVNQNTIINRTVDDELACDSIKITFSICSCKSCSCVYARIFFDASSGTSLGLYFLPTWFKWFILLVFFWMEKKKMLTTEKNEINGKTNVPRLLRDHSPVSAEENKKETIITTIYPTVETLDNIAFSHRTLSVDRNYKVPFRSLHTSIHRNEVENEIDTYMWMCVCASLFVIASDQSE